MKEYHKIHTIWERDVKGRITIGKYSRTVFEYLADRPWVFTEKVDGTNIRIYWDGKSVRFGGRTDAAQIHNGLVQHLRDTFTDDKMRAKFGDSEVCLYGEGCGAKIQAGGGNYYQDRQTFVLFDALCGKWYLERAALEDIAANLTIPIVPIVLTGTLADAQDHVIGGMQSNWGSFQSEGVVGKPAVELFDRAGERIIVKMKSKDYARLPVSA